jgi:hypothetical protein
MTTRTDHELLLGLALRGTNRTPEEHRALVACALRLDCGHGRPRYLPVALEGHDTELTASQQAKYDRLLASHEISSSAPRRESGDNELEHDDEKDQHEYHQLITTVV